MPCMTDSVSLAKKELTPLGCFPNPTWILQSAADLAVEVVLVLHSATWQPYQHFDEDCS